MISNVFSRIQAEYDGTRSDFSVKVTERGTHKGTERGPERRSGFLEEREERDFLGNFVQKLVKNW